MSRLQVGGLALIIRAKNPKNLGVVVRLIRAGKTHDWVVDGDLNNIHVKYPDAKKPFGANSDQLLPLGDKQTQDQFKKEECEA